MSIFPLTNNIAAGNNSNIWTELTSTWTTDPNTCDAWASASGSFDAAYGQTANTSFYSIDRGNSAGCNSNSLGFLCAQQ